MESILAWRADQHFGMIVMLVYMDGIKSYKGEQLKSMGYTMMATSHFVNGTRESQHIDITKDKSLQLMYKKMQKDECKT